MNQFLEKGNIENVQKTNKFLLNICDCILFVISNKDKKVPQKKIKLVKNIILINQLENIIRKKMII